MFFMCLVVLLYELQPSASTGGVSIASRAFSSATDDSHDPEGQGKQWWRQQEIAPVSVQFFPQNIKQLEEGEQHSVHFTVIVDENVLNSSMDVKNVMGIVPDKELSFHIVSQFPEIATLDEQPLIIRFNWSDVISGTNFSFSVKGVFLGHATLFWTLKGYYPIVPNALDVIEGENTSLLSKDGSGVMQVYLSDVYTVSIIQKPSTFRVVFTIIISILVSINNINMGGHLHLDVIKKVLKTPVAPAIGFCSQFLFMPLASYGFGMLYFSNNISWRLGLFTLGCSPGGTMSNFWTLMFDGDVDLSVTMTFVSTIAALGMMPLWMFTLGSSLLQDNSVTVPFVNMIASLLGLTIPVGIGIAIKHYKPVWAERGRKILRPFTLFCIVVGVCVGIYSSLYVFALFDWTVLGAGACVAWGGYAFGALLAFVCRLNRAQIVAVSIETALQNPGVAFVLLLMSLEQPDADLSAVPLIAQLMVTGIPLWMCYLGFCMFQRIRKRGETKDNSEDVKKTFIHGPNSAILDKSEKALFSEIKMDLVSSV